MRRLMVVMVLFFLASSVDAREKRRPVASEPPLVFQGGVSNDGCKSEFFVSMFPAIPLGTIVQEFIDDQLTFSSVVNISGEQFYHWWMWKPPIISDCSSINHSYKVIATTPSGRQYRATALAGGILPDDVPPIDIVVNEWGGVTFVGAFQSPLTVIAPKRLASPVKLQGGNYIPPGAVGHGSTLLVVCPACAGNMGDLYCKTVVKMLPD